MTILPTLADARDLRITYAGNPVIDRAETALRAWHVTALDDAAVMLPMWAHVAELSPRERLAVLSRFICVETVDDGKRTCGSPITDEVSWPDPAVPLRRGPVVRRVCGECADWLMGLGGEHLHPARRTLGGVA